ELVALVCHHWNGALGRFVSATHKTKCRNALRGWLRLCLSLGLSGTALQDELRLVPFRRAASAFVDAFRWNDWLASRGMDRSAPDCGTPTSGACHRAR